MLDGGIGVCMGQSAYGRGLDDHDRQRVAEHVVQVAGDSLPLVGHRDDSELATRASQRLGGHHEPVEDTRRRPGQRVVQRNVAVLIWVPVLLAGPIADPSPGLPLAATSVLVAVAGTATTPPDLTEPRYRPQAWAHQDICTEFERTGTTAAPPPASVASWHRSDPDRTLMTTPPATDLARRPPTPWGPDLAGTAATVTCAVIAWFFVSHAAHVDLSVDTGGEVRSIGLGDVVAASLISAVAGFASLRVLERATGNAVRIWSVLATVVALVSLLGTTGATDRTATLALVSLHAVVASVIMSSALHSRSR